MAEQTTDELSVKLLDVAVDPKEQSVGIEVQAENRRFMLVFSQADGWKLLNHLLSALKALLDVNPPTKPGERTAVVQKWEIGEAFPDSVWLVLHTLDYGPQSYSIPLTAAKVLAEQLETTADEVDRETPSETTH